MEATVKKKDLPASVDLGDLLAQPLAPLDFVLPGFVRGTVGGLVSPGGVGKSFWALEVAVAMSAGGRADLTGLQPAAGRVLMLSKEDPLEAFQHRLHALAQELPRSVRLGALDYRSCLGMGIDLMEPSWFEVICEAATGARLLILDTLTRFHSLDENSTQDMNQLLAQLERLAAVSGASVLFLHHTSKAAALSGQGTLQQAARGSSVLVDNARWVAFLAVMTESEARQFDVQPTQRQQYVRWNISKQNYGAALPDVWYRRGEGGVLLPVTLKAQKAAVSNLVRERVDEDEGPEIQAGGVTLTPFAQAQTTPLETYGLAVSKRATRPAAVSLPTATGAFGGQW